MQSDIRNVIQAENQWYRVCVCVCNRPDRKTEYYFGFAKVMQIVCSMHFAVGATIGISRIIIYRNKIIRTFQILIERYWLFAANMFAIHIKFVLHK